MHACRKNGCFLFYVPASGTEFRGRKQAQAGNYIPRGPDPDAAQVDLVRIVTRISGVLTVQLHVHSRSRVKFYSVHYARVTLVRTHRPGKRREERIQWMILTMTSCIAPSKTAATSPSSCNWGHEKLRCNSGSANTSFEPPHDPTRPVHKATRSWKKNMGMLPLTSSSSFQGR